MGKHDWEPACAIGDIVEITTSVTSTPVDDQPAVRVERGATYEVIGLVGRGWDLRRVDGVGPEELRIINSDIPKYVRIVRKAE